MIIAEPDLTISYSIPPKVIEVSSNYESEKELRKTLEKRNPNAQEEMFSDSYKVERSIQLDFSYFSNKSE